MVLESFDCGRMFLIDVSAYNFELLQNSNFVVVELHDEILHQHPAVQLYPYAAPLERISYHRDKPHIYTIF